MKSTILHIANYYTITRVYKNLTEALDRLNLTQIIYTAFRGAELCGANKPNLSARGSQIIYRHILNFYGRLNYSYKIGKVTKDVMHHVNVDEISGMHAHTLFSDGRVAYNIYKKFNKPYVVSIRNTDINFFFKYFFHLRAGARQTLLNAQKIVFISEAYKKRLLMHPYFTDIQKQLANKSVVIPNGIDDYWINNISPAHKTVSAPVKLLFVGRIDRGKNLEKLMNAVLKLHSAKQATTLHIVGTGKGNYYENCVRKMQKHPGIFYYHGSIHDKSILRKLYGSSDILVMPSRSETFGLVYIEALSQGIPVLYTRDEGIDGFFSEKIGEAVISSSEDDIYKKIQKIIEEYSSYSFDPKSITALLHWDTIAQKYFSIYSELSA